MQYISARHLLGVSIPAALVVTGGLGVLTGAPVGDSARADHNSSAVARHTRIADVATVIEFTPGDGTDNDGGDSVHNSGSGSTAVNTSTGGSATLTATQPRTETSTRTSTITAPRTDDHTVTNSDNRTSSRDSHDTHVSGP